MGPGGHHGPRGGFQKPKNTRATLGKLMAYLGRCKTHPVRIGKCLPHIIQQRKDPGRDLLYWAAFSTENRIPFFHYIPNSHIIQPYLSSIINWKGSNPR